ncbi:MAG: hypothetical protein JWM37_202 [Candidatus Saccharibacteria bacterium]|nr:hypothetical protein [Candidatus Saccharibacteria bacterium]
METFILQLLSEKGLPADLDEAVQEQLIHDLSERASNLVNKRIIESLSDEDATALEHLVDTQPENAEAFQQFIAEHVPNQQEITTRALLEFRALYLGIQA